MRRGSCQPRHVFICLLKWSLARAQAPLLCWDYTRGLYIQPAGAAVLGLVVSKDTRQVYSLPSEKTPYLGVEPVARD